MTSSVRKKFHFFGATAIYMPGLARSCQLPGDRPGPAMSWSELFPNTRKFEIAFASWRFDPELLPEMREDGNTAGQDRFRKVLFESMSVQQHTEPGPASTVWPFRTTSKPARTATP